MGLYNYKIRHELLMRLNCISQGSSVDDDDGNRGNVEAEEVDEAREIRVRRE